MRLQSQRAAIGLCLVSVSCAKPEEKAARLVEAGKALERPVIMDPNRAYRDRKWATKTRQKAVQKYSQAIQECPACPQAYVERSSAYYFLGQIDRSQRDARKAIALGHKKAEDYLFLASPFTGEEKREILRKGMALTATSSFEFYHQWGDVASSYFYDGDFRRNVAELEAILKSMATPTDDLVLSQRAMTLFDLGMGLEALGKYREAERAYTEAYEAVPSMSDEPLQEKRAEQAMAIHGAVSARLRGGDFEGAEELLQKYQEQISTPGMESFTVLLDFLLHRAPSAKVEDLREIAKRGSESRFVGYDTFVAAVGLVHAGFSAEADPLLRRFIEDCEANPREWGVTLRWEVDLAKRLLTDEPDSRK